MKQRITILLLFFVCVLKAQDNNDILLGVRVPNQVESIPDNVKNLLETRLYQMVTANGISGNIFSPRFMLIPRIAVLDKEILGTAPSRIVLNLELTLFVGDAEEEKGNVFQTETIALKGVGQNEQKAYIAAIKNIKPRHPRLVSFLEQTKKEIITYYEEHCDEIKKKAYALEAQNQTADAVKVIANIPISSDCYANNEQYIRKFYQAVLEKQCDSLVNVAKSKWYTDQSLEGANEAGEILAQIDPRAYCMDKVYELYDEISEGVKKLTDKEWDLKIKKVDARIDGAAQRRELILKYIENQPNNVIHYRFR